MIFRRYLTFASLGVSPRTPRVCLALAAFFLAVPHVHACNVPVFRYALERWQLRPFEVTIYHQGPLSDQHKQLVAWLNHYGDKDLPAVGDSAKDPRVSNIKVRTVDLFAAALMLANPIQAAVLQSRQDNNPWMTVRFPGDEKTADKAWSVPFTPENAKALLISPARHEIARRILSGQSAVWVFIESGIKDKDHAALVAIMKKNLKPGEPFRPPPTNAKAFASLEKELRGLEKTLKLPVLTDTPKDKLVNTKIDVRIEFSILRLARDNAEEVALVHMLMNSEEDLWKRQEPIVFPVFGRGIALYAIVGNGINAQVIEQTARFLTGPCVCEIRKLNQHPGMEILMTMDWEGALEGNQVLPPAVPPLLGMAGFSSKPRASAETGAGTDNPAEVSVTGTLGWTLTRNLLMCTAAGLALLGLVSFFIRDKKMLRS